METDTLEAGDGGTAPVSEEELQALKSTIDDIRSEVADEVSSRRKWAADIRYCRWDGQSDDGRKHKEDLGRSALPFEGASDARVRLADRVCNEQVAELVTAALRATPLLTGMESSDAMTAGKAKTLLQWIRSNLWGDSFRKEVELLAQYVVGDSPGCAVAMVDWVREQAIEIRTITSEEILLQYAQLLAQQTGQEPSEEELKAIQEAISVPGYEETAALILRAVAPTISTKRLDKAIRDLQRFGSTEVPLPYIRRDEPEMAALRVYDDVFFPSNTTDLRRARVIYRREWLSRAEVLERAATAGWNQTFVTELIGDGEKDKGKEGLSGFDETAEDLRVVEIGGDPDQRGGLYEIITAYTREATDEGAVGVFTRVFSYFCSVAATPRSIFRRRHGRHPFIYFRREELTARLLDSRGVPEIVHTDQELYKLFFDSFADHVQKNVNPPIKKPRGGPKYQLSLQPFGEIEANAREPVEYLAPPPYPRSVERMLEEIAAHTDQYFGRRSEAVPPETVQILAQARVDRFLSSLAEVFALTLQLCQEFMPEDQVLRVVGGNALPWAGNETKEIQGRYDIRLTYDMRDLDQEFLLQKLKVLMDGIRPMDMKGILPWEQFARRAVAELDPSLAELIPDETVAGQKVVQDESSAYLKLLNGIEPDMPDVIDAPNLRLETLERLHGPRVQNPQAFPQVAPASQELIQKRAQYLQFQQQQLENAAIGRRGAKTSGLSET